MCILPGLLHAHTLEEMQRCKHSGRHCAAAAAVAAIQGLLEEGNRRRKTDSTDANATSSRSHAVRYCIVIIS
jgi:hypothetical protein